MESDIGYFLRHGRLLHSTTLSNNTKAQSHPRHLTDVWNIRQFLRYLYHSLNACLVLSGLSDDKRDSTLVSADVRQCTTIARTQTDLCPCLSIIRGSSYTISCFCRCRLDVMRERSIKVLRQPESASRSSTFLQLTRHRRKSKSLTALLYSKGQKKRWRVALLLLQKRHSLSRRLRSLVGNARTVLW